MASHEMMRQMIGALNPTQLREVARGSDAAMAVVAETLLEELVGTAPVAEDEDAMGDGVGFAKIEETETEAVADRLSPGKE